jgi:hypothetical protein
VIRLLELLDVNISLVESSIGRFERKARKSGIGRGRVEMEEYERSRRYREVNLPELTVVAGWVLVMKMMYGLDGVTR